MCVLCVRVVGAKLLMLCAWGLEAGHALNPSMPQHVDAGWGC